MNTGGDSTPFPSEELAPADAGGGGGGGDAAAEAFAQRGPAEQPLTRADLVEALKEALVPAPHGDHGGRPSLPSEHGALQNAQSSACSLSPSRAEQEAFVLLPRSNSRLGEEAAVDPR